jgi:NAD(P)H-dependent FMN reductase
VLGQFRRTHVAACDLPQQQQVGQLDPVLGGVAAGTRAVQMLKPVLTVLRIVPVTAAVPIPFVRRILSEDGTVAATEAMETAATGMPDELLSWTMALGEMRRGT